MVIRCLGAYSSTRLPKPSITRHDRLQFRNSLNELLTIVVMLGCTNLSRYIITHKASTEQQLPFTFFYLV